MNYEPLDWLVVLCARIGLDTDGKMQLSRHMQLRALSAAWYDYHFGADKILICGGPSFYIRYPLYLDEPTFKQPDLSEEACINAGRLPSESAVISMWLNKHGGSFDHMYLEQKSLRTTENAQHGAQIISSEEKAGFESGTIADLSIGILSMTYHLLRPDENAMEKFEVELQKHGLPRPIPIITEEILYTYSSNANKPGALEEIREFYQKPQSHGWMWPANEICCRLEAGESLIGIKPIKEIE